MSSSDTTKSLVGAGPRARPPSTELPRLATRYSVLGTRYWLDRGLYGALLLAPVLGPFESGYPPLGRFVVATFTDLEAALILLGAIWALKLAIDPAARQRLLRLPLLPPILALLAATVVSTAFGEYKS